MNNMKALVLRSPENIEIMDAPKPKAKPGQVIVKVHECGVLKAFEIACDKAQSDAIKVIIDCKK